MFELLLLLYDNCAHPCWLLFYPSEKMYSQQREFMSLRQNSLWQQHSGKLQLIFQRGPANHERVVQHLESNLWSDACRADGVHACPGLCLDKVQSRTIRAFIRALRNSLTFSDMQLWRWTEYGLIVPV